MQLDAALTGIPVSDRAEIITEIKSHLLDAQSKSPDQPTAKILESFGRPKEVAARYLQERGLTPRKKPFIRFLKWSLLTLGSITLLILLGSAVLLYKFSPILQIDSDTDQIKVLNGLVEIDGQRGRVKIGDLNIDGRHLPQENFDGNRTIDPKKIKNFVLDFTNGKIQINSTATNQISWKCKTGKDSSRVLEESTQITLKIDAMGAKCEITIPKALTVTARGLNGKVQLEQMASAVNLNLINGKVLIQPDTKLKYKYNLEVGTGKIDSAIASASDQTGIPITVHLTNGTVHFSED
ncbi:MAG: hypothetical protein JST16_05770 [Bdellovibrionales bacterium]|nr:hypothetical protein [Bdellovibrionales bacterium]